MNEYTERFTSHPISNEELEENKKGKENTPIDFLDIDNFEKTISTLRSEGIHNEKHIKDLVLEKYSAFISAINSVSESDIILLFSKITDPGDVFNVEGKKKEDDSSITNEDINSKANVYANFVKDVNEGVLPPEIFIEKLKKYKETLESYNTTFQELTPSFKESIVNGFLLKINPLLEDKKDKDELKEILEKITFRIKDPLSNSVSIGTHESGNLTITISLTHLLAAMHEGGEYTKEFLNLIVHESLHAISAGTVLKQTRTYDYGEDVGSIEMPSVLAQWSGISVATTRTHRFRWLNEALTETLSTTIANIEPTSYHDEIRLFKLLMSKGTQQIDQGVFINAYFEKKGYSGVDDESVKHKHWKHLRNCIRDAYPHDPQFLVKLDILIHEKGIDAAINIMENWNPENPSV